MEAADCASASEAPNTKDSGASNIQSTRGTGFAGPQGASPLRGDAAQRRRGAILIPPCNDPAGG